ncbi:MAG TPA: hypothetical protein VJG32_16845 [Anaerolineae bacterium]|nr:hypothetical protein [Anaerolineae bacterium]
MVKVKGIYDGDKVILLDPVSLQPNTAVEVLIPDQGVEPERVYWQRLVEQGLIKDIRPTPTDEWPPHAPVHVNGAPISETIIEERR